MNTNKVTPQTLKGFRDFLPETMAVRNYVKNLFIEVFESFGFEPLETPTLEYASVLKGKYNSETDDKLGYFFTDKGNRQVGLRYDLTVPTAKVLAIYNSQIQLPFMRYQIQPVWRADNTQKGRYREFMQCDIDTFGSSSPIVDAQFVAIVSTVLQRLNFKKYTIQINSRTVLKDILDRSGIDTNQNDVILSIDKLLKIGEDGVKNELVSKGVTIDQVDSIFKYIKTAQPDKNLSEIFTKIESLGVPSTAYKFEPTLARGSDYYTGVLFETIVEEPKIGAIGGGGRYDKLVESLGGPDISAVGYSFGFEPLVDCIKELNLLPDLAKTTTRVMVANFGPETEKESINLANQLRSQGVNTLLYPTADKIGKQLKFASDKNIPFVALIGTNEAQNNQVTIKNLATKEQQTVNSGQVPSHLV